jgi:hypothetical protein
MQLLLWLHTLFAVINHVVYSLDLSWDVVFIGSFIGRADMGGCSGTAM